MRNFKSSKKGNTKPLRHKLLNTLKRRKTPEVPTGPKTSPIDTAHLPILFVAPIDV